MMDGRNILKIAFFLAFLVACSGTESKWMPVPVISQRPLCTSQFTLVNHACAFLPFTPTPHHHSSSPSPPNRHVTPNRRGGGGGNGGRGGGGGGRGGGGGGRGGGGGGGRRQRRNRRHHHHHHESPVQQDCCRWLKEVDDECVCDLLVHLPPFLSRPLHQYTVMVDDTCSVTFQCGSRIKA